VNCPNCNEILISVERNNVEVEYCLSCGGFFLDADEWYLIKHELKLPFEIEDLMNLNPVMRPVKDKAKKCPKCGDYMEKIDLDGVILDRCVSRHGVWFDKGELQEYFNKNKEGACNETVQFLGETLIK